MLKYGVYAKAVELLCFRSALAKLSEIYPDMDMNIYKKKVKQEYKAMLLRTPDIGGISLKMNLSHAYAIWTRGITGTRAVSSTAPKPLHKGTIAAIFMLLG